MRRALFFLALLGLPATVVATPTATVDIDGAALRGTPLVLRVTVSGLAADEVVPVRVFLDDRPLALVELGPGEQRLKLEAVRPRGRHRLSLRGPGIEAATDFSTLPGWLSIVPPLVAIGLAILFKDVLTALLLGIFVGALALYDWNPVIAFARSIDHFVAAALADPAQAKIVIFTTLLGGMVGVIGKSGGTQGIVDRLTPYATNAARGQLATWMMGILIFFDDYANTLIVGSTMRPITDRLRISREKLAYIVDSTAAPVASVFPISTWIGFEVGLIAAALDRLDLPTSAYGVFVASIPYRFYPIFALVLGLTIALTRRDFGPMLKAEERASRTGKVLADGDVPLADHATSALAPPAGIPKRALNALVPIGVVIFLTVFGLYLDGSRKLRGDELSRADFPSMIKWLQEVLSQADPYDTLLWASLAGVLVAVLLPLAQRLLPVREATAAMVTGFRSMLLALVVLVLAWAIKSVCDELHTADYVVGLSQDVLSPHWLPVLVFLVSAAIAFATGTSWGTMGILIPLVIPIAHGLAQTAGHAVGGGTYETLLLGTVSSVLAGSVWGDHCSPISDTTILSSTASGCDHIAHVRTQVPYALAIGALGMLVGDIPTAYGLSPWISLPLGSALIVGGVLWWGRQPAVSAA